MSHKTAATVAHTIGIDTGKNTLHLIGLDDQGAIVLREKIARGRIAARLANVPRCLIGIEAGMATHYVNEFKSDVETPKNRLLLLITQPSGTPDGQEMDIHDVVVGHWSSPGAELPTLPPVKLRRLDGLI
jgi:hypothetical protein